MRRVIAILLGATAFQLATAAVEARSSEIGDAVRLMLLACTFVFFLSALPGASTGPRRSSRDLDGHILEPRVVTLTLRGSDGLGRPRPVGAR